MPRLFKHFTASIELPVGIEIETATAEDTAYIMSQAEKYKRTQGFIPLNTFPHWIERGSMLICKLNGQRAGYVASSGGLYKPAIIRHNTVDAELWGQGYGTAWMEAVKQWAAECTKFSHMGMRTRSDIIPQLAINHTIGGQIVALDRSIHTRKNEIITVWECPVAELKQKPLVLK
jgi:GNAT superfamily N-acetyltransferase